MQSRYSLQAWGRSAAATLFILGPTFYFGLTTDATKMGIAAAAGAAAVMLLNLDRLKSIKLGIMEAQLRDKIEEATATIDAFQNLAAEFLAFSVGRITAGGRLAGEGEVSKRDAKVKELLDAAERMGVVKDRRVVDAVRQHHLMMAFDLCNRIRDGYEGTVQRALIDLMEKRTSLPTRAHILEVFNEHGVADLRRETLQQLAEYVAYCERHSLDLK